MKFYAPKNFKRGRLIANRYTIKDLIIASTGATISLIAEIIFLLNVKDNTEFNLFMAMLLLLPAGIAILFVVPNGIYHNIFTFMLLKIMNLGTRRKYIYGGVRSYVSEEKEKDI